MLSDLSSIVTLVGALFIVVSFFIYVFFKKTKYRNLTLENQITFSVIAFLVYIVYYFVYVYFADNVFVQCALLTIALVAWMIYYFHTINSNAESKIDNTKTIIDEINKNNSNEYSKIDGVFAVSAIIITNDNRIILTQRKEEDKWIQPGTYIRTNIIYNKDDSIPKFNTPQKELLNRIYVDTGINESNLEYVDVFSSSIYEDIHTLNLVQDPIGRTNDLKDNYLSPSPFLIQYEHSESLKTSQTHTHIDMFYIFRLKESIDFSLIEQQIQEDTFTKEKYKFKKIKDFSLDDIKEMVLHNPRTIYRDMYVLCEYAMKCYRRYKLQNSLVMRHCTFNTNNHILLIRTSNYCNGGCQYCLMSDKRIKYQNGHNISIESLFNALVNNKSKIKSDDIKLIISGGEPFIIDNLIDRVVIKIIEMPEYRDKITKLSICTNGTLCTDPSVKEQITNLYNTCKKNNISFKFVLDIPGYDKRSYKSLTRMDNGWDKLNTFIDFLNLNKIPYCGNVVISKTFKKKKAEYIKYWKDKSFFDITLSYVIKNSANDNSAYLSKDECQAEYRDIISGEYPTEFMHNIDLAIPECNDKYCQSDNIFSIYYDHKENKYLGTNNCLDKAI